MQCTIKAGPFLQALKQTKAALDASSPRSTAPYVVLRARDGQVSLSAYTFDFRIAVDLTEAATVEQEGEVALWHQQALAAVQSFQELVCLHYEENEEKGKEVALFSSGEGNAQHQVPVQHHSLERLPAFPMPYAVGATYTHKFTEGVMCETCQQMHYEERTESYQVTRTEQQQMQLAQASLLALLQRVSWVTEWYSYRGSASSGVCMEVAADRLSLLATDGFCVAIGSHCVKDAGTWKYPVLIPAKRFAQALKVLPKKSDVLVKVTFAFHQLTQQNGQDVSDAPPVARASEVRLVAGTVEVTLLPIHEKLPPYRSAIPEQPGVTRLLLSRVEFLNALKTVAPIADFTGNSVWFHSGPSTRVEVVQQPEPALREVPVLEREGPEVSLPLKWKNLLSPLQAMRSSQVVIELTDSTKPLVLRSSDEGEESLFVILPTRG